MQVKAEVLRPLQRERGAIEKTDSLEAGLMSEVQGFSPRIRKLGLASPSLRKAFRASETKARGP